MSLAVRSLIFMLQVLQSVIDDLDLLLDDGQPLGEMIVLCDAVFELMQAVVHGLRADKYTALQLKSIFKLHLIRGSEIIL